MYLSRFRFNTARRGARQLLSTPQAMHAAVLSGFADPTGHTRDGQRTLWRVDQADHDTLLYIVSPGQPDLTHLEEQAGWPSTPTWVTRPYAGLLNSLSAGQAWAFRLTANPVRDGRPKDPTVPTQRFGHVTVAQQTQWLLDRTERCGFTISKNADGVPDVIVHARTQRAFTRRAGQSPVTLATATYDGILEVIDADALRHTMIAGLGHAKAYGCGLLTLAPL
ncbi:type I-E CRISPR-associated protein Cas6/Cse3/CasE [Longispora sp. K20-0274]|uniref:type I-E CRISPR-associated protein Cas6/Cse3/CasE n=1 Tax=Longispora sp. K20-0274 TaxID=3088255 RepID=UPI00399AB29A